MSLWCHCDVFTVYFSLHVQLLLHSWLLAATVEPYDHLQEHSFCRKRTSQWLYQTYMYCEVTYLGTLVRWLTTSRGLAWPKISSLTEIPTVHSAVVYITWRVDIHNSYCSPSRYCLRRALSCLFSFSSICFSRSCANWSSKVCRCVQKSSPNSLRTCPCCSVWITNGTCTLTLLYLFQKFSRDEYSCITFGKWRAVVIAKL